MLANQSLRIILIDDMGDIISERLNSDLAGIYIDKSKLNTYFINNLEKNVFPYNEKVLVIIDATYVNDEIDVSALDVAEKIIQINPNASIHVLLGADVNQYLQDRASNGDYQAKVFLSRVRALPHIVYGGNNGNQAKITNIKNIIKAHAKKYNYKIEQRLPSGDVAPEILDKAKQQINILRTVKHNIQTFTSTNLTLHEPTTEEERVLIGLLKDIDRLCIQFSHDSNNLLGLLSHIVKRTDNKTTHKSKQPLDQEKNL